MRSRVKLTVANIADLIRSRKLAALELAIAEKTRQYDECVAKAEVILNASYAALVPKVEQLINLHPLIKAMGLTVRAQPAYMKISYYERGSIIWRQGVQDFSPEPSYANIPDWYAGEKAGTNFPALFRLTAYFIACVEFPKPSPIVGSDGLIVKIPKVNIHIPSAKMPVWDTKTSELSAIETRALSLVQEIVDLRTAARALESKTDLENAVTEKALTAAGIDVSLLDSVNLHVHSVTFNQQP
jgi:hypothetical protein